MKDSILRSKDFFLYFMGMLVSDVGNVFFNFATGWYILELTESATQAGFYMATGAIVYFILANFGAALVDRMDKVKIMYVTDFIRGSVIIIAGLMLMLTDNRVVILITLYITTIIISILGSLFGPAVASMMKYIVPTEKLQQANSYISLKNYLQNILAMALAGYIYGVLGIAWIFVINGISYIISGFTELFIGACTKEKTEGVLNLRQILLDIKEGWVYMMHKAALMRLLVLNLLFNFGGALLFSIGLPYLFNQQLGVHPSYLSNLNVVMAISAIIVTAYLSNAQQKDRIYPALKVSAGLMSVFFISVLGVIAIMIRPGAEFLFFYVILAGLFAVLHGVRVTFVIPIQTLMIKEIDKEMVARASVVMQLISRVTFPLASAMGGIIIDVYSMNAFLWVAAIIFILAMVLFYSDRHIKVL